MITMAPRPWLVALEGDLVSVKPDSREDPKEFLPLGLTMVWAALDGVPKGLR